MRKWKSPNLNLGFQPQPPGAVGSTFHVLSHLILSGRYHRYYSQFKKKKIPSWSFCIQYLPVFSVHLLIYIYLCIYIYIYVFTGIYIYLCWPTYTCHYLFLLHLHFPLYCTYDHPNLLFTFSFGFSSSLEDRAFDYC